MIKIDMSELIPKELIKALDHDKLVSKVVGKVASSARKEWIEIAKGHLDTSAEKYIKGIKPIKGKGANRTLSLEGAFPNMIEHGADSYDLRDTLLNENAKESQEGFKYRSIPMNTGGGDTQFRTISEKVEEGWIHPGIDAWNLQEQVVEHIVQIIPDVIDEIFSKLEK